LEILCISIIHSKGKFAAIILVEGNCSIESEVLRDFHNARRRLGQGDLGNIWSVRLHPLLARIAHIGLYPTWVNKSDDNPIIFEYRAPLAGKHV